MKEVSDNLDSKLESLRLIFNEAGAKGAEAKNACAAFLDAWLDTSLGSKKRGHVKDEFGRILRQAYRETGLSKTEAYKRGKVLIDALDADIRISGKQDEGGAKRAARVAEIKQRLEIA